VHPIIWLSLITLVSSAVVLAVRPDLRRRATDWLRPIRPWHVAVAALILSMVVFDGPVVPMFALAVAVILFGVAWFRQFSFLMQLGDDAFPGHHDKLIWAALMIVVPPVGVLTFWSYRQAHWPSAKPVEFPAARELS